MTVQATNEREPKALGNEQIRFALSQFNACIQDVKKMARALGKQKTDEEPWVETIRSCLNDALWQPTHRHVKRGTDYQVIGVGFLQIENAELDNKPVTIYKGQCGYLWVRPIDEFNDGRFTAAVPAVQENA